MSVELYIFPFKPEVFGLSKAQLNEAIPHIFMIIKTNFYDDIY